MDGAGGKFDEDAESLRDRLCRIARIRHFHGEVRSCLGPSGVPVMCPDAFIARPGGNVPALVLNVKVPKPVATTCWL